MFEDRADAAIKLCPKFGKLANPKDVIVVGLMRGGVVTAHVIAKTLKLKLTALVVKKIPDPTNPELGIGAMVTLKDIYLNHKLIKKLNISDLQVNELIMLKWKEIQITTKKLNLKINYHFKGKTVIVVDDGVATGASVITASNFFWKRGVKQIILATPVIASDTYKSVRKYFNRIIFLIKENDFYAVGQFYENFKQVTDEEALSLLSKRH
jgi:putative phosphoribosyl transferase